MKKLLSLLLTLAMACSLAVTASAEEAVVTAADPDLTGSTIILHTNDVHGGIAGYAQVSALKQYYQKCGAYVLLFDAGDFIQGDPTVSASQGTTAIELMNLAGYDAAALGNHEFDYGYDNLVKLSKAAKFPILSANTLYNGKTAFGDNKIFTAPDGTKIGVFGLETPETATKAHPGKIKGVTFPAGQEMFKIAQKQVDALKSQGCGIIVCLGHLGIDNESMGNRSIDLLNAVKGIDVFIDGHSHSDLEAVKAATGATVALVGTTDELGKLSNGRVDVCTGGIPEVALGGTVAAGDPLTSDASGKAVKATAAGNRILGFALVSGASGDIIPYQYSLGTLAVAAAG